ncbi:MAG: radical SAM protein [Spirochaetes bacterium]|nr:radical SAM protein [Spirochaetota bacterium]MBU0956509.1 radical SAM protein [Spirochaetota bacterium]
MYDSYGRHIHYLRISVTDRCNLRCVYCMPAEGIRLISHQEILRFEQIEQVARVAAGLGFDKLRLTGGEPLVRRGIVDLVGMLAAIPGISQLSLTSNGTLLAPLAAGLKAAGLSSINVSLDTLDALAYTELTRGGRLQDALDGIRAARAAGLPVKLNTVVSEDSDGQQLAQVREFAAAEGCMVQTIRQYRLDEQKQDDVHFMRPPPCADCNRIRLLANGLLKPCLHGDAAVPVDWNDIETSLQRCVELKPACGQSASDHNVSAIGG